MAIETAEKWYLVRDDVLKKPYISSDRAAYLFLDELAAKAFRSEHKNISLANVKKHGFKAIQSICYAAGAEKFVMIEKNGVRQEEFLDERYLERRYYNSDLNAFLGLQFRSSDGTFLKEFSRCKYIVAANIDKTREQYISYASAKTGSGMHVLLAFSDLKEFDLWHSKHGLKYKPLEVDFLGLQRLGGYHGFLVNPESNKFYLSPNFIKVVKHESEKVEGKNDEKINEDA